MVVTIAPTAPVDEETPIPTPVVEEEITLSNENVEPEQAIAVEQEENPMIQPITVEDEKELAIGEMFKENSSQNNANNDNIVLDNELSQELDQYLNNLDLPNS